MQAYQTSQYVVPRSANFLGKWRSSLARNPDSKMNVHSACALHTRYNFIQNPYSVSFLPLENKHLYVTQHVSTS
jgi:hypothetical protein